MNNFTKPTLWAFILLIGLGWGAVSACHNSSFTLDHVTDLGNGTYQLDMTFSCGAGADGYGTGAAQNTGTFAFFLSGGATVASHPAAMTSPQTNEVYGGWTLQEDTVLAYSSQTWWWACIDASCGPIQVVTQSISIVTNGLPDEILLLGMEAGGNPLVSCPNLIVDPDCYQFAADAGNDQTVYDGWAPEACATLSASASNGSGNYAYAWSDGSTSSTINVCPTSTSHYSVTVTDLTSGCSAVDELTVNVVDVHCGSNGSKVRMCKPDGTNRCVKQSKVQQKLNNGWTLGTCNGKTGGAAEDLESGQGAEIGFAAGPNPFDYATTIMLSLPEAETVQLEVYDLAGKQVASLHSGRLEAGVHEFDLDGNVLVPGFYIARAVRETGPVQTLKLIRK